MASVTIRNLSDETLRALRMRAAAHGRSMAAEIRAILDQVARPPERLRLGSALVELFRPLGGVDLEIVRDRTPAQPLRLE